MSTLYRETLHVVDSLTHEQALVRCLGRGLSPESARSELSKQESLVESAHEGAAR